jgi:hypothetical protein
LLGAIEAITIAQDVKLFIAIFLALPFLLCGFIKLYNIPFEKFVKIVFVSNFLAPKHRLYKTKNNFEFINTPEVPVDKKKQAKELKIKEKYVSKNPELIPFK